MTIAIMQPYFMPYIGYYQLLNAVDKLVLYDDVNFINKGWINRNNILVGGSSHLFTIPLQNASQNKLINEISISGDLNWKKKLLKTVQQAYQKAPFFSTTFGLLQEILQTKSDTITELCLVSLKETAKYIGIDTEIIPSSSIYSNTDLKGQERILSICTSESADHYINPIGGIDLYDQSIFYDAGIQLHFIKSKPFTYEQFSNSFVPWLSIIDVLMFNSPEEVQSQLPEFELI
jgi:hypothetical protein